LAIPGGAPFTPIAEHRYMVAGELSDAQGEVWIIDMADGSIVGHRIAFRP
jgi:hypothetical protein